MRFEYKTINFPVETFLTASTGEINTELFNWELNKLGLEGWEIVNSFDLSTRTGSKTIITLLKKPLVD